MASPPFGPGVVNAGGRYLGVWLAAAAYGALAEGVRWARAALQTVASGTWKKPAGGRDRPRRPAPAAAGLPRSQRHP
eukprot:11201779-Lingulodinium_polyedra.AAC.1